MECEQTRPLLRAGSKVFLAGHGVAQVAGREEREFGGDRLVFFVFQLASGSKLMVPSARLAEIGARDLVSRETARDLVRRVAEDRRDGPVKADGPSRKRRASSHADALLDGSVHGYMSVFLELLTIARVGKLSAGERRTLAAVRRFFLDEVGASLRVPADQLESECKI